MMEEEGVQKSVYESLSPVEIHLEVRASMWLKATLESWSDRDTESTTFVLPTRGLTAVSVIVILVLGVVGMWRRGVEVLLLTLLLLLTVVQTKVIPSILYTGCCKTLSRVDCSSKVTNAYPSCRLGGEVPVLYQLTWTSTIEPIRVKNFRKSTSVGLMIFPVYELLIYMSIRFMTLIRATYWESRCNGDMALMSMTTRRVIVSIVVTTPTAFNSIHAT